MSDTVFKVIEQVSEIGDSDYILTVNDNKVKKVAKADANLGIDVDKLDSASEVSDGDYILTVNNGEVKKVSKADVNLGGSGRTWFTYSSETLYKGNDTSNLSDVAYADDVEEAFDVGSVGLYYPYLDSKMDITAYKSNSDNSITFLYIYGTDTYSRGTITVNQYQDHPADQ